MAVRKLNPVTPGQRGKVVNTFEQVTTDRPEKSLLRPNSKTGGRNNTGKMTMRYIGGGHKHKYRVIDFKREKENIPAKVATIEYDRTVLPVLPCWCMQMVKNVISLPRLV